MKIADLARAEEIRRRYETARKAQSVLLNGQGAVMPQEVYTAIGVSDADLRLLLAAAYAPVIERYGAELTALGVDIAKTERDGP